MKNYKKQGFSLTEALIGTLIIGVAGLSVFMLISTSNQTNLTDYYRVTSESIAREVVEVFKCIGYKELKGQKNTTIGGYSLDVWQELEVDSDKTEIPRPEVASIFVRKITLNALEKDETKGVLVTVEVKPKDMIMRGLGKTLVKAMVVKEEK